MPTEMDLLQDLSNWVNKSEHVRLSTTECVLQCREAGITWQDIADRLGISVQATHRRYAHYERAQRPKHFTSLPLFLEGKP